MAQCSARGASAGSTRAGGSPEHSDGGRDAGAGDAIECDPFDEAQVRELVQQAGAGSRQAEELLASIDPISNLLDEPLPRQGADDDAERRPSGVVPDIAVPADSALLVARRQALAAVRAQLRDPELIAEVDAAIAALARNRRGDNRWRVSNAC